MSYDPGDTGGGAGRGGLERHFSRPSLRDQPDYSQRSQSSFQRSFWASGSGQVPIQDDSSFSTRGTSGTRGGAAPDGSNTYPFSSTDDMHQSAPSLLPPMSRQDSYADVMYNAPEEVEVDAYGRAQIHQHHHSPSRQHSHHLMQQPYPRDESLRSLDRGGGGGGVDDRITSSGGGEELYCPNGCGRRCFDPRPGGGLLPLTEPGRVLNGECLDCNPGMAQLDRKREARERGLSSMIHGPGGGGRGGGGGMMMSSALQRQASSSRSLNDGGAGAAFAEAPMGIGDMSGGPPAPRGGNHHRSAAERLDRGGGAAPPGSGGVGDYDDEEVQEQIRLMEQLGMSASSAMYDDHHDDGGGGGGGGAMMDSSASNLNHHQHHNHHHRRGSDNRRSPLHDDEFGGGGPTHHHRPPSSSNRRSTVKPPGPPPKEGRPMPAPRPVEPDKPPPRTNRRFNAPRGPRVPELCPGVLMSDVSETEDDGGSGGEDGHMLGEREHVVKCQMCKSRLKVDKFATLVSCPKCEAVSTASSTRL